MCRQLLSAIFQSPYTEMHALASILSCPRSCRKCTSHHITMQLLAANMKAHIFTYLTVLCNIANLPLFVKPCSKVAYLGSRYVFHGGLALHMCRTPFCCCTGVWQCTRPTLCQQLMWRHGQFALQRTGIMASENGWTCLSSSTSDCRVWQAWGPVRTPTGHQSCACCEASMCHAMCIVLSPTSGPHI